MKYLQFFDVAEGFSDGNLTLRAIPNKHLGENGKSYSYKITTEGKTVFYTGDLSDNFSDFNIAEANHCDVVISEMTHFPVDKAWSLLNDLNCGKLIFNHIGDPYQNIAAQEKVLQQLAGLSYPVQFASDGMTFEI